MRVLIAKLRVLGGHRDPEFDGEVQQHLELLTERFIRQGMPPEEAAWAARRQFGNTTLLSQDRHEISTFLSLENIWRDLAYGFRQLRLNPMFTATAVLSLALGIGANLAVFTLLDQLVLRLLPVKEPERLVMLWPNGETIGSTEGERVSSYPLYQDIQRQSSVFDYVFCRYGQQLAMRSGSNTERVTGELISGNYFQALGVAPALGRVLSSEADDRVYKGHPVVVLSHRFWTNRFAADPNAVGKKILLNSYPMEIVGVAGTNFVGLDPSRSPDLWVPVQMAPFMTPEGRDSMADRRTAWVQVFARLKNGVSMKSASAALQPMFHRILIQETQEPVFQKIPRYGRDLFLKNTLTVEPAAGGFSQMRMQYSTGLFVLMAMAALILLIACANVAGLLIAKSATRQKEIAVRLAMGAGRLALIRQLLAESTLLSLMAAALGLPLSMLTTRALLYLLPRHGTTLLLRAAPDGRILLFGIAVAVVTTVLFGLAPALDSTVFDPTHRCLAARLKDTVSAMAGGGRRATRLRKLLVTAQVALSLLLLVGAGLFAKTLYNLQNSRTGFRDIDHLITFQVDAGRVGYPVPRIHEFYANLTRNISAIPGVVSAAYASVPVFQGFHWSGDTSVEGHQAKDGEDTGARRNVVSSGYFRTIGIPLLQGRDFDDRDRPTSLDRKREAAVAIVNRQFAEHFFGGQSAVGRHVGSGRNANPTTRIIGVVGDSEYDGPRDGLTRQLFWYHPEAPVALQANFYVRTNVSPELLFPVLRTAVAKLDPSIPVDDMMTLQAQLNDQLSTERLIASLSVAFGVLATILAALGLYGVMAFTVVQRTKEIGLRMALGAPQGSVLWLVLREVLLLLITGLAVGVPGALLLSRYASSELFGVTPADLSIWIATVLTLSLVAAMAGSMPARRAASIDPITALHYE